jgi:hypothetical protein
MQEIDYQLDRSVKDNDLDTFFNLFFPKNK